MMAKLFDLESQLYIIKASGKCKIAFKTALQQKNTGSYHFEISGRVFL
jgi:hypothetical protein